MIDLSVKLNVLMDILEKKEEALTQILTICENQALLFAQPPSSERSEFLKELNSEKQILIEHVIECDDVFQSMFGEMRDQFERESEHHLPAIKLIQDKIKTVMETDVKIRAQEERNKAIVKAVEPSRTARRSSHADKNYIIKQYAKNKKPPGAKPDSIE